MGNFDLTPIVRTQLQDAALLWDAAQRLAGHTTMLVPKDDSQRLHALRKALMAESMAIMLKLADPLAPAASHAKAEPVIPASMQVRVPRQPIGKGASASGTTTKLGAGEVEPPVKVV